MMRRERVTQTGVKIAVMTALSVYAGITGGMMNERFTEVQDANVKPIVKSIRSRIQNLAWHWMCR